MTDKKTTVELTCVPKVYEDKETGTSYPYYVYYLNLDGVSVKVAPSQKDYTAKQLLKRYANNIK